MLRAHVRFRTGHESIRATTPNPLAPETPQVNWDTLCSTLTDTDLTARSEQRSETAD